MTCRSIRARASFIERGAISNRLGAKKRASRHEVDLPMRLLRCSNLVHFFPLLPNSSAPHFLAVASSTSLLDSATGGKSFIHS